MCASGAVSACACGSRTHACARVPLPSERIWHGWPTAEAAVLLFAMRVLPGHDGSPASVLAAHFVGEASRSAAECFLVVDRDGVPGDFVVYVALSDLRCAAATSDARARLCATARAFVSARGSHDLCKKRKEAVGDRPRFVWCACLTPLFDLTAAAPQAQVQGLHGAEPRRRREENGAQPCQRHRGTALSPIYTRPCCAPMGGVPRPATCAPAGFNVCGAAARSVAAANTDAPMPGPATLPLPSFRARAAWCWSTTSPPRSWL